MKEYHKINSLFKRDEQGRLDMAAWSQPEFGYLADNEWEWEEKVDGTNIRVMFEAGVLKFGGKTDNAQIQATLFDRLNERFDGQRDKLAAEFPDGVCLYGEGYGARIQKGGGNYRADQDFVLFDVRIGHWWLKRDAVETIAKTFGLDVVPVIGRGTLWQMICKVKQGFNSTWGEFPAEGIVARPTADLLARSGQRIITKLKTTDRYINE